MEHKSNFSKIPLRKILKPFVVPVTRFKEPEGLIRNENKKPHLFMEYLFKAYEAKDLDQVLELLSNGLQVNYREPARANRTPILYAAKYNYVEAVDELLRRGADPNLSDDTGITPLHVSASHGCLNPLKRLILAKVSLNAQDINGRTPLHFATRNQSDDAEDNAYNIVNFLLDYGANVLVKDEDKRTPLHSGALMGNSRILPLLLNGKGSSLISEKDKDGQTPLHLAVLGGRSLETVEILLHFGAQIDANDKEGRTPTHYVAGRPINFVDEQFDGECLDLLLTYGASVSSTDNNGYNALSLALQRTMWRNRQTPRDTILHCVQLLVSKGSAIIDSFDMWRIVETFPSMVDVAMNQSIRSNTSAKDSPHFKLMFDFRPLAVNTRLLAERKRTSLSPAAAIDELPIPPPLLTGSEISMLHYIYWAGHKNILRHPLCSAFLHLKWLKVRKFFVINVIVHFVFVLSLTSYIISLQNHFNQNKADTDIYNISSKTENEYVTTLIKSDMTYPMWFIILFFSLIFSVKEVIQIAHSPLIYIRHLENYVDILILGCIFLLLFNVDTEFNTWHRNISTIAVIASWSRLMLFLGQFPSCGVYIVMFSTVCITVLRFLAMYIPLLIAFALGFLILLNKHISFQGLPTSFVTTVIMMVGEIEYDDKILRNENLSSKFFPCFVLIVFLLLIYIILSNLLVALAVNDLNSIQKRSELLRLSRQVELMVTVETFLKSPFFPRFLRRHFKKRLSITRRHNEAHIAIYPNRKPGYIERFFSKLLFVFRCRRLLTKIFEIFVVNFIPPDIEPSLPKSILQEATNLALTELEIEKRDKFLLAKWQHTGSLRSRANYNRTRRDMITRIRPETLKFSKRSFQDHVRGLDSPDSDASTESSIYVFKSQLEHMQSRPSVKASLWRSSFRKDAYLNPRSNVFENEPVNGSFETNELRKQVVILQNSIGYLTNEINSLNIQGNLKCDSLPLTKPKVPISPLAKSYPLSSQYTQRLSEDEDESGHVSMAQLKVSESDT